MRYHLTMRTALIGVAALVLAAGAAGSGPRDHWVETATSTDGLTWTRESRKVLEQASVPAAVVTAGGIVRIYYVDASRIPETTNCADLRGTTARVLGCRIAGIPTRKALDPSIVRLRDGRYRLYYYAANADPSAAGSHAVRSAISKDGVRFRDEGVAFAREGLVDPDVFWTGTQWLMYVFSPGDHDTVVARSSDGRIFTYVGPLQLPGWGTTAPAQLPDGRLRLYAFSQMGSPNFVASFVSRDGLPGTWSREAGVRLRAEGGQLTDPFVVRLRDGTWKMVFKVDPNPGSGKPPPKP